MVPSVDTLNNAKVNVANFLNENTDLVFGIKFEDISMINLVYHEEAKNNLENAIQLLKNDEKEDAIDHIALSFRQIVDDYTNRKKIGYRSFFDFSSYSGASFSEEMLEDVEAALGEIENSLDSIEEPLRILSLGLDYRKYIRFEILTARKILKRGDGYTIGRLERMVEGTLSDEEIQFCIDFVIESAVILKDFDFELKPKKRGFSASEWFA